MENPFSRDECNGEKETGTECGDETKTPQINCSRKEQAKEWNRVGDVIDRRENQTHAVTGKKEGKANRESRLNYNETITRRGTATRE